MLQKANIDKQEKMDLAIKSYQEIKEVLLKLDEVRFAANKLMGPQGVLA